MNKSIIQSFLFILLAAVALYAAFRAGYRASELTNHPSTTTETPYPGADWLVYRQPDFQFELKYPSIISDLREYHAPDSHLPISFEQFLVRFIYDCPQPRPETIPVLGFRFAVTVAQNPSGLSLQEWIQRYEGAVSEGDPYYVQYVKDAIRFRSSPVTIARVVGIKANDLGIRPLAAEGNTLETRVYLPKRTTVYILDSSWIGQSRIADSPQGQACIEQHSRLFDELLSTFRFTD